MTTLPNMKRGNKFLSITHKLILLSVLIIVLSCSKVDKQATAELTVNDTVTHKPMVKVDSSQRIYVKYNHKSETYYEREKYQNFTEWFNNLNKNFVFDPDVAHELYLNTPHDDSHTERVSAGPDFYFLYAHLLQKRNGIADHAKLREKLMGIFGRINSINKNLHFDNSFIFFSFQRTAIAAYTEYAIYNYIRPGAEVKNYNINKQKALFIQALSQRVFDELHELENISHSHYALLDEKEKVEHEKSTLMLIEELDDIITSHFDLNVAQQFHYKYY